MRAGRFKSEILNRINEKRGNKKKKKIVSIIHCIRLSGYTIYIFFFFTSSGPLAVQQVPLCFFFRVFA